MKKFIEKINQKENTIMVCCIFIIFACIIFFFTTYSKEINENDFVYAKNLEERILTITSDDKGKENILLKDFSYYVIVAEASTQSQALFFNESDATNYWELKITPIENLRASSKEFCINICIKDHILYMEALKNNITLDETETKYVEDTAYEIYSNLTGEQVDTTNLELSDIVKVLNKIFLAEKYTLSLLDNKTISTRDELSYEGKYYLEEIKPHYNIEENKEITDNLLFGRITVNTHLQED